jgi:hypothetical protein
MDGESTAETAYRYSRLSYYSYYLAQGIAGTIALFVLLNRDLASLTGKLLGLGLCVAFAVAMEYERRVFRKRPFTFRLDALGIRGETLAGGALQLRWADIGAIERPPFQEVGWRGPSVLLVSKADPTQRLIIAKHLPGYSRLAEQITFRTPGLDHSALSPC